MVFQMNGPKDMGFDEMVLPSFQEILPNPKMVSMKLKA
jgi:hypothetical protein